MIGNRKGGRRGNHCSTTLLIQKSLASDKELNRCPLDHEACAQPHCYNHYPICTNEAAQKMLEILSYVTWVAVLEQCYCYVTYLLQR